MAAYKCPITKEEFHASATPAKLILEVNGKRYEWTMNPKDFDSGSVGYGLNTRPDGGHEHAGKMCDVMIGFNYTLVGSKKL